MLSEKYNQLPQIDPLKTALLWGYNKPFAEGERMEPYRETNKTEKSRLEQRLITLIDEGINTFLVYQVGVFEHRIIRFLTILSHAGVEINIYQLLPYRRFSHTIPPVKVSYVKRKCYFWKDAESCQQHEQPTQNTVLDFLADKSSALITNCLPERHTSILPYPFLCSLWENIEVFNITYKYE